MKNRMSLVDVLAEVADLRKRILGMRVMNVYDVDGDRTFLIKFAETGKEKQILLIESGVRIHTTRYARDKPLVPGGFAIKLRKHLRGRRLTKLTQVGIDRVVDCTFGSGNATYHLIIELYDKGNIILTDKDYSILSLLRSYILEVGGGTTASAFSSSKTDKHNDNTVVDKNNKITSSSSSSVPSASSTTNDNDNNDERNDNNKNEDDNDHTTHTGKGNSNNNNSTHKQSKGNKGKTNGSTGSKLSKDNNVGNNTDNPTSASLIDTQRVRIAVKQKYVFATDANLLRTAILGPDPDEMMVIEDDNQVMTKENEGEEGEGNTNDTRNMDIVDEITNVTDPSSIVTTNSTPSSVVPTPAAVSFLIDVTHPTETLVQSVNTFLTNYEDTKLAGMPNKLRKKVTLASALVSRGSGLDVFGPLLVEHAIVKSGLLPDCKIETVYTAVSTTTSSSSSSSPANVPSLSRYDTEKLTNLAKELRYLPSILRNIANNSHQQPAYAIVESKLKSSNTVAMQQQQQQQNIQDLMKKLTLSSSSSLSHAVHSPTVASPTVPIVIQGCLGTWAEIQAKTKATALSASNTPKVTANETNVNNTTGTTTATIPSASSSSLVMDEGGDTEGVSSGQVPPTIPYSMIDFIPQLFAQYGASSVDSTGTNATVSSPSPYIVFPSFDTLCDEYFSQVDIARAEKAEAAVRSAAEKKLDRVKEGHLANVNALQSAFQESYRCGRMIEDYADTVDAACLVIRSALEHSVNWIELENLVIHEATNMNPIASRIAAMDLPAGKITLAIKDKERMNNGWQKYRTEQRLLLRRTNGTMDNNGDDDNDEEYNNYPDDDDEYNEEIDDNQWEFEDSDSDNEEGTTTNMKRNSKKGRETTKTVPKIKKPSANSVVGKPEYYTVDEAKQKFGKFIELITVNVFLTAAANAREYYVQGKAAKEKEERTIAAAEVAIRKAEKQVEEAGTKQINDASSLRAIKIARKPHWFERFYWCITSEGLIVVAGRNAQDNEQLVKRYLRPQDAYIHADIHGAATVILRNRSDDPNSGGEANLPALSLSQAGSFCICLSSAWSAHATCAAWWVPASAVSKTAPTGEYLPTGSFMIRGKKKFLPPVKLELGVVLLWKIDESCIDNHQFDRKVRGTTTGSSSSSSSNSTTVIKSLPSSSSSTDETETLNSGSVSISLPVGNTGERRTRKTGIVVEEETEVSFIVQSQPDKLVGSIVTDTISNAPFVSSNTGEEEQGILMINQVDKDESEEDNNDDGEDDEDDDDDDDDDDDEEPEDDNEAEEDDKDNEKNETVTKDQPQTSNIAATTTLPTVTYPITAHVRRQAKKLQSKNSSLSTEEALRIAAETEALKKRQQQKDNENNSGDDDEDDNDKKPVPKGKSVVQQPKRGQKSKLRKAKEKYNEQDDEDREIALAALGHKKKIDPPPVPVTTSTTNTSSNTIGKKQGKTGAPNTKKNNPSSRKESKPSSSSSSSHPTVDNDDDENNSTTIVSSELEARSVIAALVSVPRNDDILTHAVPMLCPWQIALAYKYRAKLTPGSLKKGKTAQSVLHHWSLLGKNSQYSTPREADLIKSLIENEVIGAVVGGCKVSAGGGLEIATGKKK